MFFLTCTVISSFSLSRGVGLYIHPTVFSQVFLTGPFSRLTGAPWPHPLIVFRAQRVRGLSLSSSSPNRRLLRDKRSQSADGFRSETKRQQSAISFPSQGFLMKTFLGFREEIFCFPVGWRFSHLGPSPKWGILWIPRPTAFCSGFRSVCNTHLASVSIYRASCSGFSKHTSRI